MPAEITIQKVLCDRLVNSGVNGVCQGQARLLIYSNTVYKPGIVGKGLTVFQKSAVLAIVDIENGRDDLKTSTCR